MEWFSLQQTPENMLQKKIKGGEFEIDIKIDPK